MYKKLKYFLLTVGLSSVLVSHAQETNENEQEKMPELPPKIMEKAIEEVVELTPEEIELTRKIYEMDKRAENSHLYKLKPVVSTERFPTDPSYPVPIIKTIKGANTSISFLDSMGNPWPYELVSYGSDAYKEGSAGKKKRHIAEIVVERGFVPSTLFVMLEGRDQLLNFMLVPSDDRSFDLSKTIVVDGQSPESKKQWTEHIALSKKNSTLSKLPSLDSELNLFLDNTPPAEAESIPVLDVSGVQAWKYKGKMVIRANKRLNWPSSVPLMGLDEFRVYELPHASPVLTFVEKGRMMTAHIPDDALADLPRLTR